MNTVTASSSIHFLLGGAASGKFPPKTIATSGQYDKESDRR